MRERGLKPEDEIFYDTMDRSLPMRERGLKLHVVVKFLLLETVAPHAGAWIETSDLRVLRATTHPSLLMWERGLKQQL